MISIQCSQYINLLPQFMSLGGCVENIILNMESLLKSFARERQIRSTLFTYLMNFTIRTSSQKSCNVVFAIEIFAVAIYLFNDSIFSREECIIIVYAMIRVKTNNLGMQVLPTYLSSFLFFQIVF